MFLARKPLLCLFAGFFLLAAAPARADFPHAASSGGLDVTPITGDQQSPSLASDGQGGFIVTWNDSRNYATTSYDIYAQRYDAFGHPLWAANGVPVCTSTGSQNLPIAVSDGAGGAVILWRDDRTGAPGFYAQRLNKSGAPQWTANGIKAFAQPHTDYTHAAVSDGAGGIWFIAPRDSSPVYDCSLQHVTAVGALPLGGAGVAVRLNQGKPLRASIVADGAGGAFVAWVDTQQGAASAFAQHFNAAGTPLWISSGALAIWATYFGLEAFDTRIDLDGVGGVYVAAKLATSNQVIGNAALYVQHLNASGSPMFPANYGRQIAGMTVFNDKYQCVADGTGGLLLAWRDSRTGPINDICVQYVSPLGEPLWAVGGQHLPQLGLGAQYLHACVPDGRGGASFICVGGSEVYSTRVTATGATTTTNITTTPYLEDRPTAIADGDGGMFLAWDSNGVFNFDLMVSRLDRYGMLGANGPRLRSVKDVAHDQGGLVKVSWDSAWLDNDTDLGVQQYRVWRSVAAVPSPAFAATRPRTFDSDEAAANGWLLGDAANATIAWELVGTQPAALLPSYSFAAPTGADSVAAGVPWTAFRIEAFSSTAIDTRHWWSVADSGYSVDDLPPVVPAALTGAYSAGATTLQWQPNSEADLAGYRLYRGVSNDFTPGPGSLVAEPTGRTFVDAATHPFVYKLSAIDVHGNESPVTTLALPGVTGVSDAIGALTFAAPSPSPAHRSTTLRFELPQAGHARISLIDVAGRNVRVVHDGAMAAGKHEFAIACDDGAGRALAAGLYFVRLEANGTGLDRKLLIVR